jgi:hypothetical protein
MPCAACNVPEEDVAPRMPDGFKTEVDRDQAATGRR